MGLSGSTDGASSCAQNGPASPACATSDGGNGNGGTGAPGGIGGDSIGAMAVSAVTYLAAPVLMAHPHVKPQIVVQRQQSASQ